MDETVDLHELALATSGAVGADLANIINEGALAAVRDGRSLVSQQDLIGAVEVVFAGKEKRIVCSVKKKSRSLLIMKSDMHCLQHSRSIRSRSRGLRSFQEPWVPLVMYGRFLKKRKYLESKKELEAELVTLLGGRAAEELKFDSVTTGASNDIEKATKTARA